MHTIVLIIDGMSCAHCVHAATDALRAVPGVTDARVSLTPPEAIVAGSAPADALIAALAEEGYPAALKTP